MLNQEFAPVRLQGNRNIKQFDHKLIHMKIAQYLCEYQPIEIKFKFLESALKM